jgi:hypothetical protein
MESGSRNKALTNMLSILAAAPHLGKIIGPRELFLLTGQVRSGTIGRVVELQGVS